MHVILRYGVIGSTGDSGSPGSGSNPDISTNLYKGRGSSAG